jgi:hypothetical protein
MLCQLKERSASNCRTIVGSKECFRCGWYVEPERIEELKKIVTRKED